MKTPDTLTIPTGFNPEADAELTTYPAWNGGKAFHIAGIGETVVQAAESFAWDEPVNIPPKPQTAVKAAPEQPQAIYNEPSLRDKVRQYLADAHIRKFDRIHGTDLYGELQKQRRADAVFLKAGEIGLLGRDSLYYRRKLGQLTKD